MKKSLKSAIYLMHKKDNVCVRVISELFNMPANFWTSGELILKSIGKKSKSYQNDWEPSFEI